MAFGVGAYTQGMLRVLRENPRDLRQDGSEVAAAIGQKYIGFLPDEVYHTTK